MAKTERVIQIAVGTGMGKNASLYALTDHGRLFMATQGLHDWVEVTTPQFDKEKEDARPST